MRLTVCLPVFFSKFCVPLLVTTGNDPSPVSGLRGRAILTSLLPWYPWVAAPISAADALVVQDYRKPIYEIARKPSDPLAMKSGLVYQEIRQKNAPGND
ncbi:hypothetical protein EJ03DRAFT_110920 [Teratosphaeria nubilosa]|uniref:Uncharacterized protein n=1 Tax=Teratosphaeria nubilosa TaxID=161662 RepID=A0A6G1L7W2_9PEZI|nr:hypothetical protein EJ03DRAFT_110920 [Teratosphaeria nubilosa]